MQNASIIHYPPMRPKLSMLFKLSMLSMLSIPDCDCDCDCNCP